MAWCFQRSGGLIPKMTMVSQGSLCYINPDGRAAINLLIFFPNYLHVSPTSLNDVMRLQYCNLMMRVAIPLAMCLLAWSTSVQAHENTFHYLNQASKFFAFNVYSDWTRFLVVTEHCLVHVTGARRASLSSMILEAKGTNNTSLPAMVFEQVKASKNDMSLDSCLAYNRILYENLPQCHPPGIAPKQLKMNWIVCAKTDSDASAHLFKVLEQEMFTCTWAEDSSLSQVF